MKITDTRIRKIVTLADCIEAHLMALKSTLEIDDRLR